MRTLSSSFHHSARVVNMTITSMSFCGYIQRKDSFYGVDIEIHIHCNSKRNPSFHVQVGRREDLLNSGMVSDLKQRMMDCIAKDSRSVCPGFREGILPNASCRGMNTYNKYSYWALSHIGCAFAFYI